MTAQEIIDEIISKTKLDVFPKGETCDRLISGNSKKEVHKIATTFMLTADVLEEAVSQGVDMVITHEPTWYTGADSTEWLLNDPVYKRKEAIIEESGIVVWRFHDYMHMSKDGDGIYRGFEIETGWEKYQMKENYNDGFEKFGKCYNIPETSLEALCLFFRETMKMKVIQIIGDRNMLIQRVAVLVGGGSLGLGIENLPMRLMNARNIELAICGDITEWTLPAYIRDASQLGMKKAMLTLGHERSEEWGMKYLVNWLAAIVKDIEICFIDAGEPFSYL